MTFGNILRRLLDVDCFEQVAILFNRLTIFRLSRLVESLSLSLHDRRCDIMSTFNLSNVVNQIWMRYKSANCQRSPRQMTPESFEDLHLYLLMINCCEVAPLVELYCDRRVLAWIDYSVMRRKQQLDCWSVSSCLQDWMPKWVYCLLVVFAFF